MDYCIGCGEELCILDEDPNGDIGAVCARCEAEEDHDWDEYPDVEFDRSGEMIDKNDKFETKPGFIQIGDIVVNKMFIRIQDHLLNSHNIESVYIAGIHEDQLHVIYLNDKENEIFYYESSTDCKNELKKIEEALCSSK